MTDTVVAAPQYECKHVLYFPMREDCGHSDTKHDLLLIKEQIHHPDGTLEPRLTKIYDWERPFYVTKPLFRNHQEKKEWEDIAKLERRTSTQVKLVENVARALGKVAKPRTRLKELARSPYLYGVDASPSLLMKKKYQLKYPNAVSKHTVAVLDTEWDMETEELIIGSVTFKNRSFLGVTKEFIKDIGNPIEKIRAAFTKYLGNYEQERKINLDIEILENEGDLAKRLIEKAHEWKPDILAIWNVLADIPKILDALKRYGHDPVDVFSDPSIPPEFRKFEFTIGPPKKTTASGRVITFDFEERWHTVDCPASFYILDAMCVYWRIRMAKGKLESAALDAILNKHLGIRKLKFEEADGYEKGDWHRFMQKNFKVEYCIYNQFDCISMELLDEKINDLGVTMGLLLGASPYSNFASQPQRLWDAMYFECLEDKQVPGSTSDKMANELDDMVVSLDNWIMTLPSHTMADDGLEMFSDLPGLKSFVRKDSADLD